MTPHEAKQIHDNMTKMVGIIRAHCGDLYPAITHGRGKTQAILDFLQTKINPSN